MNITGIKELIIMFLTFLTLLGLWASVNFGKLNTDYYLPTITLDQATPFDVTIDLELIRPAYEQ